MHHVAQWFSLRQRNRRRIADFAAQEPLQATLDQLIREWNQPAHPFHWSTTSVAQVMAGASALAA
jgi:hypothetical protein